jgi:hypothetical protein
VDSTVYGTVEWFGASDTIRRAVRVTQGKNDSLRIESAFGGLLFELQSRYNGFAGNLIREDQVSSVSLTKVMDEVHPDLAATRSIAPIELGETQPTFSSHLANGDFYFVDRGERLLYYAEKTADGYEPQPLEYDRERYVFSSLGYDESQNTLIAHGTDRKGPRDLGGSIFSLQLNGKLIVDTIRQLPNSVNTYTYDNFPDYASDGRIVYSSWGRPDSAINYGKADIYYAVAGEDGSYTTVNLSERINTPIPDAGPSMAFDDRLIMFHRRVEDAGSSTDKLFFSVWENESWSIPKRFEAPVNVRFSFQYGPRLDQKEEYLYYTSGHRGETHLYRYPINQLTDNAFDRLRALQQ